MAVNRTSGAWRREVVLYTFGNVQLYGDGGHVRDLPYNTRGSCEPA